MDVLCRGFERVSQCISSSRGSLRFYLLFDHREGRTLDPQGPFLQGWNMIFIVSCVFALAWDPLFFYILVIDGKNKCLKLDATWKTLACVLRTVSDLFYLLHIIIQFRTGFIAPTSFVYVRGELNKDPVAIAKT